MNPLQTAQFTIADHTLLVQAVLERPLHVIHYLAWVPGSPPTDVQVLDAALKVRSFDDATKTRLRVVRELLPGIEQAKEDLPREFLDAIDQLQDQITERPLEEKLSILAKAREGRADDDLLTIAADAAQKILRDGAKTIYAPDFPPLELLESKQRFGVQDVAAVDVIGGSIGAAGGFAVGGPAGAAAGAAVGAGATSAGAGIVAIAQAVFS